MKVLLVSPYHGGSHQAWAEGYRKHSQNEVHLLTLPARFWKWRMHGGAITLTRKLSHLSTNFSVILATDMLDLTTFLALTRSSTYRTATALYLHENQLTYPLPEDPTTGAMRRQLGERDRHYAFINYASMLAADRIFFNSKYHMESFFHELRSLLKHFPEYRELSGIQILKRKSSVLPVGINLPVTKPIPTKGQPPLILWNQRWEYDKNPQEFFQALYRAANRNLDFRLALCGERFARQPEDFQAAAQRLGPRLVHVGFSSRKEYLRLLRETSIVLSTAIHEFFGISILEAITYGAFPILPRRLSYPELIPREFHSQCLYSNREELDLRLSWALLQPHQAGSLGCRIADRLTHLDWRQLAPQYDSALEELFSLFQSRS